MKKEEENSATLELNDLSSLSQFSTPNTYRISSKSPEDLSNLINDIDNLAIEISEYAEKNANLRLKCKELEENIEEITNELNQHIDESEKANQKLVMEIQQVQNKIQNQEKLKDQLVELYESLASQGINLQKFQNVDYNLLVFLAGGEIPVVDELNSEIQMIISSEPFFQNCRTNEDFINRCSELVQEASNSLSVTKPSSIALNYEELILKLQQKHDQKHSEIANEMKILSQERDELLKQIKYIKNAKPQNNYTDVSQRSLLPNQSLSTTQRQNSTSLKDKSNLAPKSISHIKQKTSSNRNQNTKSRHHHHHHHHQSTTLNSATTTKLKTKSKK